MMSKKWQEYSDKYIKLTSREQYLVLFTGIVAIFFISFYLFIDVKTIENKSFAREVQRLQSANRSSEITVIEMQEALKKDPNEDTINKIAQYEAKLTSIDEQLLLLTNDLISPVQMRYALLDLLKIEKGVSLLSCELTGVQPLLASQPEKQTSEESLGKTEVKVVKEDGNSLNLYRHGIKIKLSGSYFDLQSYLSMLENLSWKFFWKDFNFKLKQYPNSELEIEMYSLGTKKEFIGV